MERYKKKDILQTVDTLLKANDAVLKTAVSNPQGAAEVLVQCQESAIILGTYIDTLGETYAHLVHLLEDYCESIYQMSESLSDENACRKTAKKIQEQLTSLQNGIKNDIPEDKKEVVFLPYKASMWDSLESVWKAADADENTDAYVIPIPYFSKNPDGSFREEHYEGDLYPKNVPITRYDEYDLEARRPDIIYIHNPYDECNHVTSVHPYFYSKNLRNYTDQLVYIPYFVLKEIEPDDQEVIDGMKHFCFTPGTIYANQVILQSENIRQIYINEFIKAAKEMGLGGEYVDREFLEKKFLGTGSPKFDKLLNTKKEDLDIPAEWLKIIERPDGSWKKIVFYNISVSALLQDKDKLLRKMESVFEIFKENKDEVVLLWRPHPLIQSTIGSMRPQLWEAYKEIRDKYIEEGWGIYDDSADIDRAIILSDAYYGVGSSSVVQLCQKAKMPMMIQNVNITGELLPKPDSENCISTSIEDAVIHKGKIWFIANGFNSLFCMDMTEKEAELVGIFPNEAYGKRRLYESMKVIGEKIYFVPFYARSIAVFDIKRKKFKNLEIDKKQTGCGLNTPLFGGAEIYGKYLYILPVFSRAIIRLNTDNDNVEYIDGWLEEVESIIHDKSDAYFRRQSVLMDDKLMVPFCNANAVLELDCGTAKYKVHRLGTEKRGYSGICYDGESYWLSSRMSIELVRWNVEAGAVEVIKPDRDETIRKLYAYVGVLYRDGVIAFRTSDHEREGEMTDARVSVFPGAYTFAKEENDILLYYREDSSRLTVIDKGHGCQSEIEIKVKCADIDRELLIKELLVNDGRELTHEDQDINVESMIEVLRDKAASK